MGIEQLPPVLGRKLDRDMLAKSWRSAADVHSDVEDAATHHPHQFVLGERRRLEMQSTQGADFSRQRMIVLHEIIVETGLEERLAGVDFRKEAAIVAVLAWGDNFHIGYGGGFNL